MFARIASLLGCRSSSDSLENSSVAIDKTNLKNIIEEQVRTDCYAGIKEAFGKNFAEGVLDLSSPNIVSEKIILNENDLQIARDIIETLRNSFCKYDETGLNADAVDFDLISQNSCVAIDVGGTNTRAVFYDKGEVPTVINIEKNFDLDRKQPDEKRLDYYLREVLFKSIKNAGIEINNDSAIGVVWSNAFKFVHSDASNADESVKVVVVGKDEGKTYLKNEPILTDLNNGFDILGAFKKAIQANYGAEVEPKIVLGNDTTFLFFHDPDTSSAFINSTGCNGTCCNSEGFVFNTEIGSTFPIADYPLTKSEKEVADKRDDHCKRLQELTSGYWFGGNCINLIKDIANGSSNVAEVMQSLLEKMQVVSAENGQHIESSKIDSKLTTIVYKNRTNLDAPELEEKLQGLTFQEKIALREVCCALIEREIRLVASGVIASVFNQLEQKKKCNVVFESSRVSGGNYIDRLQQTVDAIVEALGKKDCKVKLNLYTQKDGQSPSALGAANYARGCKGAGYSFFDK